MMRLLAIALVLFMHGQAFAAERNSSTNGSFSVEVDKARILRLPRPAAAVVIGNPAIADAAIHDSRLLLVTGKAFGTTNIIAIDGRGNIIAERDITVVAPHMAAITYYRGGSQRTYSCANDCELIPSVGNDPDVFDSLLNQQKDKAEQGSAAASAEGSN